MNATADHAGAFATILGPIGVALGQYLAQTSRTSLLAYGIGFLILVVAFLRDGNKVKCFDMDGVPMKELRINGAKAAILFHPPQVSKQGEKLAHDEPYVLRDGRRCDVVLHAAEHIREFLRNDSKDHFRPTDLGFGDYFYRVLGQCVGATSGETWRTLRSYFDPAYTHHAALNMLPNFQSEVSRWLTSLKNDSLRTGVGRLVVHAPTSCKVLPLRVIPKSFYGEVFDDDAYTKLVRISQYQAQALKNAVSGGLVKYRWYNMLPTPSKRQLDIYRQEWEAFNLNMIETARKNSVKIPAEHSFKGVQSDGAISMDQYLQTIDEMIFTNIDITAGILAFMLDKLAKHPEYQQKLYEEITAQKSRGDFDVRSYITRQTSLLHYLCLECIRLRPATWFSAPECTSVDKVIGRYKIPAQTPVIIDVRRLNTNALTWGPDGAEFRPERFASMSPNEYRYGYMRFGVVSGKCLGKHMADVLMKVALITVLEQYRVEEVEMNIGVKDGDLAFIKRN